MWTQLVFSLMAVLLLTAGQANALWTTVVTVNGDTCDPLGLATDSPHIGTTVDELGTSPGFALADEGITAFSSQAEDIACPSNFSQTGKQILLSITNLTTRTFSDLWYVSDPETSLTNADGTINSNSAFKIDGTVTINPNNPLIFESISADEYFTPGETWTFIIDGYSNAVSVLPSELGSVGVGFDSADPGTIPLSTGSIVTLVPEPSAALLMGLGLAGLAVTGRRSPPRTQGQEFSRLN